MLGYATWWHPFRRVFAPVAANCQTPLARNRLISIASQHLWLPSCDVQAGSHHRKGRIYPWGVCTCVKTGGMGVRTCVSPHPAICIPLHMPPKAPSLLIGLSSNRPAASLRRILPDLTLIQMAPSSQNRARYHGRRRPGDDLSIGVVPHSQRRGVESPAQFADRCGSLAHGQAWVSLQSVSRG